MNLNLWKDKRVFLTGHTGFKGAWLSLVLEGLGAKVFGYSLSPSTNPNLFELANVAQGMQREVKADIRDLETLKSEMKKADPEVVLHLAAQPLVRESYRNPLQTWSTNVMGTVNLLEAIRLCPNIKAVLVVTTDKCYENREWEWGYRENDTLGGIDPYSASKASSELVVSSYRRSFFLDTGVNIATARAGNVIGGGDWSIDRLIPDAVKAVGLKEELIIRNPNATRPWQHVLDAISGYILLAERLISGDTKYNQAFNFGPESESNRSVHDLLNELCKYMADLRWTHDNSEQPHESSFLFLDTSLVKSRLNWQPNWGFIESVKQTASWYQEVLENPRGARDITLHQINLYQRKLNG